MVAAAAAAAAATLSATAPQEEEEAGRSVPAALSQERGQRVGGPGGDDGDDVPDQEPVGHHDGSADSVVEEDIPEEVDSVEEEEVAVLADSEGASVAPAIMPAGASKGSSAVVEEVSSGLAEFQDRLEATEVVGQDTAVGRDVAAGVAETANKADAAGLGEESEVETGAVATATTQVTEATEEEFLLNGDGDARAAEAAVMSPTTPGSNIAQGGARHQALGGARTRAAFPEKPSDGEEPPCVTGVGGEGSDYEISEASALMDDYDHLESALVPENGTGRVRPEHDGYGSGKWDDGDSFDYVEAAVAPGAARRERGDDGVADEAGVMRGSLPRLPSPSAAGEDDDDSAAEIDSDIEEEEEDKNASSVSKLEFVVAEGSGGSSEYGEESFVAGSEERVASPSSSGVVVVAGPPAEAEDGEEGRSPPSPVREGGGGGARAPTANSVSDGLATPEGGDASPGCGEVDDDGGDGYYSDSFEETDPEEEEEEEVEADGGDAVGNRGDDKRHGGVEVGLGSADRDRDGDGELELSSPSEVCSDVEDAKSLASAASASAEATAAAVGSFSVDHEYVEDALPADDDGSPAVMGDREKYPTDGDDDVEAEMDASSVASSSWRALVFDASPSTVKGGGGEEGEEQSPATALGSPGEGVDDDDIEQREPSGGSRADLADEVSGLAGEDVSGAGGLVGRDGVGLLERFESVAKEKPEEEEESAGEEGDTGDASSAGLVLPSPGETVGGPNDHHAAGSFRFYQDYVEEAEDVFVSSPTTMTTMDGRVQTGEVGRNYSKPRVPTEENGEGEGDKSALLLSAALMVSSPPTREGAGPRDGDGVDVARKQAVGSKALLDESLDESLDKSSVDESLDKSLLDDSYSYVEDAEKQEDVLRVDEVSEGGVVEGVDDDEPSPSPSSVADENIQERFSEGGEEVVREEEGSGWDDPREGGAGYDSGEASGDALVGRQLDVEEDLEASLQQEEGYRDNSEGWFGDYDYEEAAAVQVPGKSELAETDDNDGAKPSPVREHVVEGVGKTGQSNGHRNEDIELGRLSKEAGSAISGGDELEGGDRAVSSGGELEGDHHAISSGDELEGEPHAVGSGDELEGDSREISGGDELEGDHDAISSDDKLEGDSRVVSSGGDELEGGDSSRRALDRAIRPVQDGEDGLESFSHVEDAEAPPTPGVVPGRRLSPELAALGRMDSAGHDGFESPTLRHCHAGFWSKGRETRAAEEDDGAEAELAGAAGVESYESAGYVEDAELPPLPPPPVGVLLPEGMDADGLAVEGDGRASPESGVADNGGVAASSAPSSTLSAAAVVVQDGDTTAAADDAFGRTGEEIAPAGAVGPEADAGGRVVGGDRAPLAEVVVAAESEAASTAADDDWDDADATPATAENSAATATATATAAAKHLADRESLVDRITDELMMGLLKSALKAPPEQQSTLAATGDDISAAVPASDEQQGPPCEPGTAASAAATADAAAGGPPSGGGQTAARIPRNRLAEAVQRMNVLDAARGSETELSGDGKAGRKWEQLTSDEDAEEEEEGEVEDWGNAAVTETYRNEGGGMSSPAMEERGGGATEIQFLVGERGAADGDGHGGDKQEEEEEEVRCSEVIGRYSPPAPPPRFFSVCSVVELRCKGHRNRLFVCLSSGG